MAFPVPSASFTPACTLCTPLPIRALISRAVRFGVQGGLSIPMGDDSDFLETGFTVGGLVDYMPATLPGLQLSGEPLSYDHLYGRVGGDRVRLATLVARRLPDGIASWQASDFG